MSGYSFKAFNPATGAATAFLPDYSGANISLEMSDVGALKLSYPKAGRNYDALNADRVEVGVFHNGVEIDDGRFTMDSGELDEVDFTGMASFSGRSLLHLLDYCVVYPLSGTSVATSQVFAAQTPGAILRAFFQQNSTRGGQLSSITWASFTNSLDSNGVAWANTIGNIEYKVGTSYLDIVRNMIDNGLIEVKMVGRDLRIYNAGAMGVDRTITNPPIVLRKGKELLEAPTTSTSEQIAGVALIEGDEAVLMETSNGTVNTAWGRRETYISQGGISDTTTLGVLSAQELTRRSAVRRQKTRKLNVKASGLEPNVDYKVSDYIFSDTTGVNERLRVRQLVVELDNDNIKSASIVLNDKFLEQEIAIARKVAGILGGATATGSIANPAPVPPTVGADTTIPSQVTGLSWTSAAFQNAVGVTEAQITATWSAVTTNTNATVIDDLDFYEVMVKRNSTSDWGNIATTQVDTTTAYMTVPANMTLDVRVRAVDRNGNKGAWSTTSTATSAADSTAPPVPKTPVVVPYLGQIRIFWDGLGSVGEAMPTDFWRIEVHMSTVTGFTPSSATMVDSLLARGYSVQTDLTYGTPYYVKFISVDYSGNKSAASAQATTTPETVTGLDIAALTIATSNLGDLAVTTAKMADLSVISAKIANLAVDDAKIGSVSVGKLTAGTLSADMTVSARIKTSDTGARVEINSSGFRAYNSAGDPTVLISSTSGSATITGSYFSAFAGSAQPYLTIQDSGDRTTIYFVSSLGSSQFGFINSPADSNNIPRMGINSGEFTYDGVADVRSKLFLATTDGISLESTGPSGQLGYALYLKVDQAKLERKNAAGFVGAGYGINLYDTQMIMARNSPTTGSDTGAKLILAETAFYLYRVGAGVQNGGQIYGDTNLLWLSAIASGTTNAEIRMSDNGDLEVTGRFVQDVADAGKSALFVGTWSAGANTSFIVSYGTTMVSRPQVLYSVHSGSNIGDNRLTVFNTTGFTYNQANSVAINLNYWCYRTT